MAKLGKAVKAGQAAKSVFRLDAFTLIKLLVGAVSLPFVLLAVVALAVICSLMSANSAVGASSPGPVGSSAPALQYWSEEAGGDGTGAFDGREIKDKSLIKIIEGAAGQCKELTPVILAAQIRYASDFNAELAGADGRAGLSQLTPDVFKKYGRDDDKNGKVSVLDAADDIQAHARYFCYLAGQVKQLLASQQLIGDQLSLTLMAWDSGLDAVKAQDGMPIVDPASYPFQVRQYFADYTATSTASASATPSATSRPAPTPTSTSMKDTTSHGLSEARFDEMFPNRDPLYTYAGLTDAMTKFSAFATVGDQQTRAREMAAFLANVDHETGGLTYIEESNQAAWGDYCQTSESYGCPAGTTAYHGRGPIQLSWNYNYKAAGDALGLDLLDHPDLVKTDSSVAWQTAFWFWMTQSGTGTTAHAAITSGEGFGATIRVVNGIECGGAHPDEVNDRINDYKRIAGILGVDPGADATLTC